MICQICGKGMFYAGTERDPSSSLQARLYRCYSFNPKHDYAEVEIIPGFEDFSKPRNEPFGVQGRRYTHEDMLTVMALLSQGMRVTEVYKKTGVTQPTIYRMKIAAMVAVVSYYFKTL